MATKEQKPLPFIYQFAAGMFAPTFTCADYRY